MIFRARIIGWTQFLRLRRRRQVQTIAAVSLTILAPLLSVATYLVLGPFNQGASSPSLRLVILADVVYVLLLAALVLHRVVGIIAARRAQSAGSRLHLRLTGVFALLALLPTVSVAVFAVLTINMGLEAWFSERVRRVVGNALMATESYEREQRQALEYDTRILADIIDTSVSNIQRFGLRAVLKDGQLQVQRGLREAYIVNGIGELQARGDKSYLFDYEKPNRAAFEAALEGQLVIIPDLANDELRALIRLGRYLDKYLLVSRKIDGHLFGLLDEAQETAKLYQEQEALRGQRLFEFAIIYLGFALIIILAAMWLGLLFAERLSRPVGRLTTAAQQVGGGDLDVQVVEEQSDDEIGLLSRYFNQMTRELKAQQDRLLENTRQTENRRRLFDSVLSSVTSGVIGVDPDGQITLVNRAAQRLLDGSASPKAIGLGQVLPEFRGMFERLQSENLEIVRSEIKIIRFNEQEHLLVRLSTRRTAEGRLEGYVVAFDDVTDLVVAQRTAAWGDVARRIAHEIKNPLTPIQLSAERISRKFSRQLAPDEAGILQQMTGIIVRQTNDLRHIVDEFSKFARMPEPQQNAEDIVAILRDSVVLQDAGQPDVTFEYDITDGPLLVDLDRGMISQAFGNLLKNAAEATETKAKSMPPDWIRKVKIYCEQEADYAVVKIADNGVGLPPDRSRLFEPYVTTREKGTGLGLPIVKKIIEDHSGTLSLHIAPIFAQQSHAGAMACVRLKLLSQLEVAREDGC